MPQDLPQHFEGLLRSETQIALHREKLADLLVTRDVAGAGNDAPVDSGRGKPARAPPGGESVEKCIRCRVVGLLRVAEQRSDGRKRHEEVQGCGERVSMQVPRPLNFRGHYLVESALIQFGN